jgi:hypothetical protein
MNLSLEENNGSCLPRPFPGRVVHTGSSVVLEPLSVAHLGDLWAVASGSDSSFDYLRYGPFPTVETLKQNIEELSSRDHQPFWAVRDIAFRRVRGWLSLCDVFDVGIGPPRISRWGDAYVREVRSLRSAGCSSTEISTKLGLPLRTVFNMYGA